MPRYDRASVRSKFRAPLPHDGKRAIFPDPTCLNEIILKRVGRQHLRYGIIDREDPVRQMPSIYVKERARLAWRGVDVPGAVRDDERRSSQNADRVD